MQQNHEATGPQVSPFWQIWRWPLHWQILLGLLVGGGIGWWLGQTSIRAAQDQDQGLAPLAVLQSLWSYRLVTLVGTLFLNGLKMIVVPLVVSSLVLAVAGLGQRRGFARMGLKTLAYYLCTSTVAIIIGLLIVNMVRPGASPGDTPLLEVEQTRESFAGEIADLEQRTGGKTTQDFLGVFEKLVPANLFQAALTTDLLGLIVVSLMVGYFTARLVGRPQEVFVAFWEGVYQVTLWITQVVIALAPLGVAGLIGGTVSENYAKLALDGRLTELLASVTSFFFVVLGALAAHFVLTMGLILLFIARVNPLRHYRAMGQALLTAFSSSSSSATLPVTLRCVEQNAGVSRQTASFVLPLGATVNMDGTALYECVAAMFVAQLFGIELSLAQQFFVVLVALLTSIGVAGVPSASLVAIVIILQGVGVPIEGLAIVLLVDRPLDMLRTAMNVFSDSVGAVVIARSEGEQTLLVDAAEAPVDRTSGSAQTKG